MKTHTVHTAHVTHLALGWHEGLDHPLGGREDEPQQLTRGRQKVPSHQRLLDSPRAARQPRVTGRKKKERRGHGRRVGGGGWGTERGRGGG